MLTGRRKSTRPSWSGVAFVVEAMLLLVFLVGSLALFTSLFASSVKRGDESRELTVAVAVASDTAERFAADPLSVPASAVKNDMVVTCDVTNDARDGGIYRKALITVYDAESQPVYSVTTAVYESGVTR